MNTFKNYTPHTINMNNGEEFISLGLARVSSKFSDTDSTGVCTQEFGDISGLPQPEEGVLLIVSGMVLSASNRGDLVAPATGHPDTLRNDKGHIVSVPCFVR